jgi:monomeric isocitrate dehydrogenase
MITANSERVINAITVADNIDDIRYALGIARVPVRSLRHGYGLSMQKNTMLINIGKITFREVINSIVSLRHLDIISPGCYDYFRESFAKRIYRSNRTPFMWSILIDDTEIMRKSGYILYSHRDNHLFYSLVMIHYKHDTNAQFARGFIDNRDGITPFLKTLVSMPSLIAITTFVRALSVNDLTKLRDYVRICVTRARITHVRALMRMILIDMVAKVTLRTVAQSILVLC